MTIADRIQSLRKAKGISQEELADKIGVSRQAVSKWESEQSSPDMEKVILLSDYFDVTTDYLLKGIEPKPDLSRADRRDARMYSTVGTAINFAGLIIAIMIWIEKQTPLSVAVGFILLAVGCTIHVIGQLTGEHKTSSQKWFTAINVWFLLLMPVTCIFNFIQGTINGTWWTFSPFPSLLMLNSHTAFILCWLLYAMLCIITDVIVITTKKTR